MDEYYCRLRQQSPTIVYNKLRDVCKFDESNTEQFTASLCECCGQHTDYDTLFSSQQADLHLSVPFPNAGTVLATKGHMFISKHKIRYTMRRPLASMQGRAKHALPDTDSATLQPIVFYLLQQHLHNYTTIQALPTKPERFENQTHQSVRSLH